MTHAARGAGQPSRTRHAAQHVVTAPRCLGTPARAARHMHRPEQAVGLGVSRCEREHLVRYCVTTTVPMRRGGQTGAQVGFWACFARLHRSNMVYAFFGSREALGFSQGSTRAQVSRLAGKARRGLGEGTAPVAPRCQGLGGRCRATRSCPAKACHEVDGAGGGGRLGRHSACERQTEDLADLW